MIDYLHKIDALVAEHVMGWVEVAYVIGGYGDGRNNTYEGPWYEWQGRRGNKERFLSERIPSFSSSIESAWQVFEKMRAEMWNVTIHVQSTCDSAPLAICLAALKARGIELPVPPSGGTQSPTDSLVVQDSLAIQDL